MKIATASVNWNNNDVEDYRQWTPYPQLLEEMLAAGYTATEWDVSMEKDAGKMLADLRTRGLRMLGRFVGLELRNPARREGEIELGLEISRFLKSIDGEYLIAEVHTPSGNWSSFPPHRHDTRDNSSYHEETYYHRLTPADGFAIQRIYTRDADLDLAILVQNGDLVLVHEGYHPVVKAPGTNAYYLNFLAGDVRKISPVNDPHYDWLTKNRDGNPIEIPVK